jgi:hypothetical protein
MSAAEAPSALLTATMSNAKACAQASVHTRDCEVCPRELGRFLDSFDTLPICEDGQRILRLIAASEREIAEAVRQPMRRELAS